MKRKYVRKERNPVITGLAERSPSYTLRYGFQYRGNTTLDAIVDNSEEIKIVEKIDSKNNCVKDYVIVFPESFGIKPISFVKTGLINHKDFAKEYRDENGTPVVTLSFYGNLERIDEPSFTNNR